MITRNFLRNAAVQPQAEESVHSRAMAEASSFVDKALGHVALAKTAMNGAGVEGQNIAIEANEARACLKQVGIRLTIMEGPGRQTPMLKRVELLHSIYALQDSWQSRPNASSPIWTRASQGFANLTPSASNYEHAIFEDLKKVVLFSPQDKPEYTQAMAHLTAIAQSDTVFAIFPQVIRLLNLLADYSQAFVQRQYMNQAVATLQGSPQDTKEAHDLTQPRGRTEAPKALEAAPARQARVVKRKPVPTREALPPAPPSDLPSQTIQLLSQSGLIAQSRRGLRPTASVPVGGYRAAAAGLKPMAPRPQHAHKQWVSHLTSAMRGTKIRVHPNDPGFRALGLTNQKLSILEGEDGQSWVVATTKAKGGSGKMRPGQAEDGTVVAFKVARTAFKVGSTHPEDPTAFLQEAQLTAQIQNTIEQHMAQFMTQSSQESLLGVCEGITPFKVYGVIHVKDPAISQTSRPEIKMYMPMTKDVHSLHMLSRYIATDSLKKIMAASFAATAFSQLDILQRELKMIHNDLSLANFTFTKKGYIRMMDFGRSSKINSLGVAEQSHYLTSTLVPELADMMPGTPYRRSPSTKAQDVFALAANVASLIASKDVRSPFYIGHLGQPLDGPKAVEKAFAWRDSFVKWRESCRGENNSIQASRVNHVANPSGDPLKFGLFFSNLARIHPLLFELLLNDAMDSTPSRRANVATIAQKARLLAPRPGSAQWAEVAGLMKTMQLHDNEDNIQHDAPIFREWEINTRASRTVPPHPKGAPRPLP